MRLYIIHLYYYIIHVIYYVYREPNLRLRTLFMNTLYNRFWITRESQG